MKIPIDKIKVRSNRREAKPEVVKELAKSMDDIGMVNPITVDAEYYLVAGLHRLEAAKLLGWNRIECSVLELEELDAKLVEIDENVCRTALSDLELSTLILQRKKIYEAIHPERKRGGNRKGREHKPPNWRNVPVKSFAEDTAQLLGVSPRTVERYIQIGQKLTPETKRILERAGGKITQQVMEKLTRLKPGQQEEVAVLLAEEKIQKVEQYDISQEQKNKSKKGFEKAALYLEAFDQAMFQVRHLIGLFQERQEIYAEILTDEQLEVLGGQAVRTTAVLEEFVTSLKGGSE